jgi:hypothetical protein
MRSVLLAAFVAATGVGCASSAEIQQGAYAHLQRAQYYQAQGDYERAARERRAANKQFAKAQARAYDETYYRHGYYW